MATDGGASGQGNGPIGGAIDRLGQAVRGGRQSWTSGKLEFDTSGVKQFAVEIGKAEKTVGKFVGHFERLDKILKGMDKKKLDALAAIGGKGGGGAGSYVDASPVSASPSTKAHTASTEREGDESPSGYQGYNNGGSKSDPGAGRGGPARTDRAVMGGGISGAYFAGEVFSRVGSRISASMDRARQDWASAEYAENLGKMRAGANYQANWAEKNFFGAADSADVFAVQTRNAIRWGEGFGGAAAQRHMSDSMGLAAINPGAYASGLDATRSVEDIFASTEMQWALKQRGITPALQGGNVRDQSALYSDIMLRAMGVSSWDDVSMERAEASFGMGGQARLNIRSLPGMTEEMVDTFAILSRNAAGGRGVNLERDRDQVRNTILGAQFERGAAQAETSAAQARGGADNMQDIVRAENEVVRKVGNVAEALSSVTPALGKLGEMAAGAAGALSLASAALGTNQGEGGGGAGGVLGTALGYAGGQGIVSGARAARAAGLRGALRGGAGFLGRKVPWIAGALGAYQVADHTAKDEGTFNLREFFDSGTSIMDRVRHADDMARGALNFVGLGDPVAGASPLPNREQRLDNVGDPGDSARVPGDLDPGFAGRLRKLFDDAPFDITVSSGRRSTQRQEEIFLSRHTQVPQGTPGAKLYKGKYYKHTSGAAVAVPGTSKHEKGHAVDLRVDGKNPNNHPRWKAWVDANIGKYGLRTGKTFGEWWHIETPGTVSEAAAGAEATPVPSNAADTPAAAKQATIAANVYLGEGMTAAGAVGALSRKGPGLRHNLSAQSGIPEDSQAAAADGGPIGPLPTGAGRISQREAYDLARAAGFSDSEARVMAAIAVSESGLNPRAHNPNAGTGDNSYGLWQINMLGAMGPARRKAFGISSNEELFDPLTNAKAARNIWQSQGFNAWSVYKNGSYRAHLDKIGDPVGDPVGPDGRGDSGGTQVGRPRIVSPQNRGSSGGGVSAHMSVSRPVTVQQLNLNLKVDRVTDEEARRLAIRFRDFLLEETEIAALGGAR